MGRKFDIVRYTNSYFFMVLCLNKRVIIQLYIQRSSISINWQVSLTSISIVSLCFEEHVKSNCLRAIILCVCKKLDLSFRLKILFPNQICNILKFSFKGFQNFIDNRVFLYLK